MAGLIAAHGVGWPFARVAEEFGLQMAVGAAVGLVGDPVLWFMRAVPL